MILEEAPSLQRGTCAATPPVSSALWEAGRTALAAPRLRMLLWLCGKKQVQPGRAIPGKSSLSVPANLPSEAASRRQYVVRYIQVADGCIARCW